MSAYGRQFWASLIRQASSFAARLVVGILATGAIVSLFRVSPFVALTAMVRGAVGSANGLSESLLEGMPLLFTGLGVALAFRCHLWNIGAEGQYLVGALAGLALGVNSSRWPAPLLLPAVLAAAALAGAAWAAVAALLRVYRGVPEVISTIMLNFVALNLVSWAATGPLKEKGQEIPRTPLLPEAARLAPLGNGGLHLGLYLAPVTVLALVLFLFYTTNGFRIRAVGLNPNAAAASGMPVQRTLLLGFVLSGALAGLAGGVQLAGVTYRVYGGSSPGYGYTAIAVALVGQLHPIGVLLSALFFGALVAGSNEMQRTAGVSSVIAYVIQALVVFLLIAWPQTRVRPTASPVKEQ
jgi:simple sugar transport system permease protein